MRPTVERRPAGTYLLLATGKHCPVTRHPSLKDRARKDVETAAGVTVVCSHSMWYGTRGRWGSVSVTFQESK